MIFPRTVLITSAMLLAASVHAADVSMANGQVHFTTPNGWLDIMETEGDPEARVFQVPDPSPTAHSSLARVTVTVKQTADMPAFQQYVGEATAKAAALPGYTATAHGGANNTYTYTAQEAGAQQQVGPDLRAPLPAGETVLRQQVGRVLHPVEDEALGHDDHHQALHLPTPPAAPILGRVQPGIVSDALVLDFLDRMPPPDVAEVAFSTGEMLRVGS